MSNRYNKRNDSGCMDLTAYEAMCNVEDEGHEKFQELLALLFKTCDSYNFSVKGRIVLKDNISGKIYR